MGITSIALSPNGKHKVTSSVLRRNILATQIPVHYNHVYGHLDDKRQFVDLTLPEQLNVMADSLAKETLLHYINKGNSLSQSYPHESVRIWISGSKVTSSIRDMLYRHWGAKVAKDLFERRCIVHHQGFDSVAWEYVGSAINAYPQLFRLWPTKHVSGFNGINRQLSCFQPEIRNCCPCCGHMDKSNAHLIRCPNPGRWQVFQTSVDSLLDWMETTHGDISLIECLKTYLFAHGEGSMVSIAAPFPDLSQWAMELDMLGWDSLLEGRIGKEILSIQEHSMQTQGSQ